MGVNFFCIFVLFGLWVVADAFDIPEDSPSMQVSVTSVFSVK